MFHWRNNNNKKCFIDPPVKRKGSFWGAGGGGGERAVREGGGRAGLQRWLRCRYTAVEHQSASGLVTLYGKQARERTKCCFMDYKRAIGHAVT